MEFLPAFIRTHRAAILAEWRQRAELLPTANGLPRNLVDDHIPRLLDRLAEAMERGDTSPMPLAETPAEHATQRFAEGYDLREVVTEYRLLRRVILDLYAERGDISEESRQKLMPLTVMNEALDRAIADAVDHHALRSATERERFIAILGHDLRDPLNSIAFGIQNMRARLPSEDDTAERLINRLSHSVKRMSSMIADMLDFARARLGTGLPILPAQVDAREIVARVTEETALAHPERDIQERLRGTPDVFQCQWDRERVAQAIANLLGNALTHGADPVTVELEGAGTHIVIAVTNRGEIPIEHRSRLFEPFVGGSARPDSLGLGLYIVKEIARAHGGTVEAQSGEGHTQFRLLLPRLLHPASGQRRSIEPS